MQIEPATQTLQHAAVFFQIVVHKQMNHTLLLFVAQPFGFI
eukprot:UN20104